jgi:anti-sigma factor RsiW
MEKHEMGHRSDEITAYLSDSLEQEQKASLEAHLTTCEECQGELAAQQALFSDVNEVLAFKPKRTIDEQVARFEREVAAERKAAPLPVQLAPRRSHRRWMIPAVVALAASAAGILVLLGRPGGGVGKDTVAGHEAVAGGDQGGKMAAPHRPAVEPDGGVDGGDGPGGVGMERR